MHLQAKISDHHDELFDDLRNHFEKDINRKLNNREVVELCIEKLHQNIFDEETILMSQLNMKDMVFNEMTNLLGSTFTSFFQLLDEIRTRLNLVDSKLDLDIQKSFETYEVIELMMRMMFMPDPLTKQIMRPANASEVDRALSTDYIATSRTRESAKLKYEKAMKAKNWQQD